MKRSQRIKMALVAAALGLTYAGNILADGFYFGLSGGITAADVGSRGEIDAGLREFVEQELGPDFPILSLDSSLDDTDTGWSVQIGYGWGSHVAVEIGYIDFGDSLYEADLAVDDQLTGSGAIPLVAEQEISSQGITASVLGVLPFGEHFEAHGRAGVYFGDTRTTARVVSPETGATASDELRSSSRDFLLGIGATWIINDSYSVRFEYQRFLDVGDDEDLGDEVDIDMISLGILFR